MGRLTSAHHALLAAIWLVAAAALVAPPIARAQPPPGGEALACGQELTRTDENGTFHLRFQCLPSRGLLNWGFTLAPQWQSIAIGPVTESGIRYWRNGGSVAQNSDHPAVSVDYFFHGTMTGVLVGERIEYQDFFTFKANFGAATGTARVAIAGSVILQP